MKNLFAAFLFSLGFTCAFANPTTVELIPSVSAGTVTVSATAAGGLGNGNLKFRLRNTTNRPINLKITPGLHFKAADAGAQDLLTVQEMLVALKPKSEETVLLTGFCMQARNYSPQADMVYAFNGAASPDLRTLSDSLSRYEPLATNYGQMFVWAITDNKSMRDIWVSEKLVRPAASLMKYVANLTGLPLVKVSKDVDFRPNGSLSAAAPAVNIFSKTATLAFHNPTDQVISFKIYDDKGQVYHSLLENKRIKHGLTQYTFGINEVISTGENPVFYAKVTTASGQVLAQMKVDKNTEAGKVTPHARDFNFGFELKKGVKAARLNVYLEDGTLVEEFKKYEYLPVGHYNFKVTLLHLYPASTRFVVKMIADNGAVVAQQAVK